VAPPAPSLVTFLVITIVNSAEGPWRIGPEVGAGSTSSFPVAISRLESDLVWILSITGGFRSVSSSSGAEITPISVSTLTRKFFVRLSCALSHLICCAASLPRT